MSMESLCTIGAMASKKANALSSVSAQIAFASGSEVSGPVATMTFDHSAGGLTPIDLDQGMLAQRFGNGGRKPVAIDRQCATGRNLVGVGGAHDQRAEATHFGMQQPHGIVGGVIG